MKVVSTDTHFDKDQAGNSTLEILIALALLTTIMACVIQVTFGNQTVSAESQLNTQALAKAMGTLEKAQAQARVNFAGVISSASADDLYTRQLVVTDLPQCRKHIISRINWNASLMRPEKIELTTTLSDLSIGGDCPGTTVAGTWVNPQAAGTVDLGQSKATGIDVRNQIVFLATEASAAAKPDFFIVDAANPAAPIIKNGSGLDTGPSLNGIDVAGNYAFVANRNTANQLQVIDISNLAAPLIAAQATLPVSAVGSAIAYANSRIYIGTPFTAGKEFHIYDVTVPTAPVWKGSIETGRNVNAIVIEGTTAYVAVGSSAGDLKDVQAYDVSNPAHIVERWSLNLPGGGGKSLSIVGDTLSVGCFKMTGKDDLYLYDLSTPAAPTLLGSTRIGSNINGIRVAGNFAFLATSDSTKEFQVWNIANPAAMSQVSSLNFPQETVGVDYENNTVYAGVRSNDSLRIITSP